MLTIAGELTFEQWYAALVSIWPTEELGDITRTGWEYRKIFEEEHPEPATIVEEYRHTF